MVMLDVAQILSMSSNGSKSGCTRTCAAPSFPLANSSGASGSRFTTPCVLDEVVDQGLGNLLAGQDIGFCRHGHGDSSFR